MIENETPIEAQEDVTPVYRDRQLIVFCRRRGVSLTLHLGDAAWLVVVDECLPFDLVQTDEI